MERSYSAGARARDARPEVIVGIRNPLRGSLVCGFAPPHAESEEAKRFATLLGVEGRSWSSSKYSTRASRRRNAPYLVPDKA